MFPQNMIMTMRDKMVYDNSTLRQICDEDVGEDILRDHCHLSGKFTGAANEVCKLKLQGSKVFPSCISQFVRL